MPRPNPDKPGPLVKSSFCLADRFGRVQSKPFLFFVSLLFKDCSIYCGIFLAATICSGCPEGTLRQPLSFYDFPRVQLESNWYSHSVPTALENPSGPGAARVQLAHKAPRAYRVQGVEAANWLTTSNLHCPRIPRPVQSTLTFDCICPAGSSQGRGPGLGREFKHGIQSGWFLF